jgi:hypothetical protein
MQILLRHWGNERYVWKTAKYNGKQFVVEGADVEYTNVISVVNDNRKEHVVCSACGKFLKNTPKAIEEHKHLFEQPNVCLTCRHMRVKEQVEMSEKFTRKKDGTYVKKNESRVTLGCRYGRYYGSVDINSYEAKEGCALRKCAVAEFNKFQDIFLEYPSVFDHMAMVDKIIDVGYKRRSFNGKYSIYQLKGRNQISAYVNDMGIIDYFRVSYHEDTFNVFYSKKYDLLFVDDGLQYRKFDDWYALPTKTREYIKRKIAELYV